MKVSSVNVTNSQESADLVTFTEEIFNEKIYFLCSAYGMSSLTVPAKSNPEISSVQI